jgi:hypothetical protein
VACQNVGGGDYVTISSGDYQQRRLSAAATIDGDYQSMLVAKPKRILVGLLMKK